MSLSSPAVFSTLAAWAGTLTTCTLPPSSPTRRQARSSTAMPELSINVTPGQIDGQLPGELQVDLAVQLLHDGAGAVVIHLAAEGGAEHPPLAGARHCHGLSLLVDEKNRSIPEFGMLRW